MWSVSIHPLKGESSSCATQRMGNAMEGSEMGVENKPEIVCHRWGSYQYQATVSSRASGH